ncbi:nitrate reductase molybdenum cofactor assembly chaperone [Pleionea sediminis]|uniref:nitrate reductase molybdenum cofactor assembly chaperone n=1 Tax=Pleionea sediminis TaxID=2569479 RepID=UPI0011851BBD|nr:nitrate reductase molybdenum cofactor assembly chaperone [Pleionea sediminis]
MKALRVISLLLDYPTEQAYKNLDEIVAIIDSDTNLDQSGKNQLNQFVAHFRPQSLLDWQAYYEGLFDRGRALSLLLFEHVHGESRDRGQAMIDLQHNYKEAGLEIGVKELPDYIPLFLEFLSTQGEENAQHWLQDVAHILAVLAVRLEKRDSLYSYLFKALLSWSQAEVDLEDVKAQIADEKRDDTPKAIDKVWEEEMVTFGPDSSCGSDQMRPTAKQSKQADVPIGFVNASNLDLTNNNASQAS